MNYDIPYLICNVLAFIPAIVLHEVSHGFVAYKLGDPTAKSKGRLTLNPLAHIDPWGTVLMPLMLMAMNLPVFGYAKPVPYNPFYFKDKRKGDLLVGLAGPVANLVMALLGGAIAWALWPVVSANGYAALQNEFAYYAYAYFLQLFILLNLYLMFFNLLPIPPLDGSSIFAFLLPEKYLPKYYEIQRYAMPVFMIVVILVPYVLNVNPIGIYLSATAGNLASLLSPIL